MNEIPTWPWFKVRQLNDQCHETEPSIVAVRQEAIGNVCHDRKVGVDAEGLKALKLVYEKKL